jgi:hypothetical protein
MSTVNSRTFDFLKMRRAALLTAALGLLPTYLAFSLGRAPLT